MKNLIDLSQPQPQNQATQEQLNEQLLYKAESDVRHVSSQAKLLQQLSLTNIHVFQIERLVDNTLYCKELGGAIPTTRLGNLNKAQLAREISERKRLYPLK